MKVSLKQEILIWAIIAIPFIYLLFTWGQLPAEVPIHWNIHGEADRWSEKKTLPFILALIHVPTYFILAFIPSIDPRYKSQENNTKFNKLRIVISLALSLIGVFAIYSSLHAEVSNMRIVTLILGGLFVAIGNYLPALQSNYFIGVRTPWTLESKENWRLTHRFSGKVWFGGGLLICIGSLIIPLAYVFYFFITITVLIALLSVGYSYWLFRKEKQDLRIE